MKAKLLSNLIGIRDLPGMRQGAVIAAALVFLGAGVLVVKDSAVVRAERELENQVRALNAAVKVHEIFSGSLDKAKTPTTALAQLKQSNLERPVIEFSLRAEMQDSEEAATAAPRVVWNRLTDQFQIVHGALPGVKRFFNDESINEVLRLAKKQRDETLELAETNAWIWNEARGDRPVATQLAAHASAFSATKKN